MIISNVDISAGWLKATLTVASSAPPTIRRPSPGASMTGSLIRARPAAVIPARRASPTFLPFHSPARAAAPGVRLVASSVHLPAAVDVERRTRDVFRPIGGEERHHLADVRRGLEARERDPP